LPRTLVGRSITIKLLPKKPDEKVADFSYGDDEDFAKLRRKLARWARDNAAAIKEINPRLPPHFSNRLAANWKLLLAIAERTGSRWPKLAREAAERVGRISRKPSLGVQLLAAIQIMFAAGRTQITSQEVVVELLADPEAPWGEYRGGQITQRQVADLLERYDIRPEVLHPTKRAGLSRRGYRVERFADAFARFLPADPNIRTPKTQRTKP
jgi:putative DNA primase/helicase